MVQLTQPQSPISHVTLHYGLQSSYLLFDAMSTNIINKFL